LYSDTLQAWRQVPSDVIIWYFAYY